MASPRGFELFELFELPEYEDEEVAAVTAKVIGRAIAVFMMLTVVLFMRRNWKFYEPETSVDHALGHCTTYSHIEVVPICVGGETQSLSPNFL